MGHLDAKLINGEENVYCWKHGYEVGMDLADSNEPWHLIHNGRNCSLSPHKQNETKSQIANHDFLLIPKKIKGKIMQRNYQQDTLV